MDILLLFLATWRVSHLITYEAGPYNVLGRLREFIGIKVDDLGQPYTTNEAAEGIKCLWCNSLWFGLGWMGLYAVAPTLTFYISLPFALSAAAILINEAIEWLGQTPQHS